MNTPEETATLIATAFKRSNLKCAKLSMAELQIISRRFLCSNPFIIDVMKAITNNNISMVAIDTNNVGFTNNFILMCNVALADAKNLQVSILLTEGEIKSPHTPELLKELHERNKLTKESVFPVEHPSSKMKETYSYF